ncbi:MAG TPA: ABC transporter family substrate-binding protein, partial [Pseudonocardia sp.]|uniref:ABC transporter family substrate-binding protein n=1 Tax=Pseudonocardia sp. TaxID=60912 RepID=UPI002F411BD8
MITRRQALQGGGLLATSLFLAACGSGARPGLRAPGQSAGHNDINPMPRARVRDGGELRWTLDAIPDNFNRIQFDGTNGETKEVMDALLPRDHFDLPDGTFALDTNYFTSAKITSTAPQVVTYTINPKATWSDSKPITWQDLASQWRARNGSNPAFLTPGSTGYAEIASITRGADDRQATLTYGKPFAEWQGTFNPLYPVSTTSDPAIYNTGWINKIPTTAGPFTVESIDLSAKTITLRRNEKWWGERAKLDRIVFKVYERSALADALANNEIDFYEIASSVDLLRRAQTVPGVAVRQATGRPYNHITFNGAAGAILADVRLRRAIAKGIDRAAIATRLIGQIVPGATSLGNHIYPYGAKYYQDNSKAVAFDQAAANRELDELGWVRPTPGAVRTKNGQPLKLRFIGTAGNPISDAISKTTLDQLGQTGVQLEIDAVSSARLFVDFINVGNFDLVGFVWESTSTPFSSSREIYAESKGNAVGQNYGRIFSPQITALFEQGLAELDDDKRAAIGNQADQLIWQEVHHLPLYPSTGAYAVRATLANFGAPGFADIDYI